MFALRRLLQVSSFLTSEKSNNTLLLTLVKVLFLLGVFVGCWKFFSPTLEKIPAAFAEIRSLVNPFHVLVLLGLAVTNWSIESKKWQVLIGKETISLADSAKSILRGVSVSMFFPARQGQVVGKLSYFPKEKWLWLTKKHAVGALFQLFITLFFGCVGVFLNAGVLNNVVPNASLILKVAAISCLVGGVVFFLFQQSKRKLEDGFRVFTLSLLRYLVFTSQFALLFVFFTDVPFLQAFGLIGVVYFLAALLPFGIFGELGLRESLVAVVFSIVLHDVSLAIALSLLIWCVNLILPALIGGFFWLKK